MSNFKQQFLHMPVHVCSCRCVALRNPNKLFKKLRVIVILLSLLLAHVAFAQREKIDSLKKELPSLHDSARVDCLNELSGSLLKLEKVPAEWRHRSIAATACRIICSFSLRGGQKNKLY
jgi:hypothetical protein